MCEAISVNAWDRLIGMRRVLAFAFVALAIGAMRAEAKPLVYVTNGGSNNVSVIDTATNTVVATIPIGGEPFGMAIAPDGNRAYVTNVLSNNVSVIDTTANNVVATIPVGIAPAAVAVTPDGKLAYVANRELANVSMINTAANNVVATITVGNSPGSVAIAAAPSPLPPPPPRVSCNPALQTPICLRDCTCTNDPYCAHNCDCCCHRNPPGCGL